MMKNNSNKMLLISTILATSLISANCSSLNNLLNAVNKIKLSGAKSKTLPTQVSTPTPNSVKKQNTSSANTNIRPRKMVNFNRVNNPYNIVTNNTVQNINIAPAALPEAYKQRETKSQAFNNSTNIADDIDFINKMVKIELTYMDPIIESVKGDIKNGQVFKERAIAQVEADQGLRDSIVKELNSINLPTAMDEIPTSYINPAFCFKENLTGNYKYNLTYSYDKNINPPDLCNKPKDATSISWNEAKTKVSVVSNLNYQENQPLLENVTLEVEQNVVLVYDATNPIKESTLYTSTKTTTNPTNPALNGVFDEKVIAKIDECGAANCLDLNASIEKVNINLDNLLSNPNQEIQNINKNSKVKIDIIGKADDKGGQMQATNNGVVFQDLFNGNAELTAARYKETPAAAFTQLAGANFTIPTPYNLAPAANGLVSPNTEFVDFVGAIKSGSSFAGFSFDSNFVPADITNSFASSPVFTNIINTQNPFANLPGIPPVFIPGTFQPPANIPVPGSDATPNIPGFIPPRFPNNPGFGG